MAIGGGWRPPYKKHNPNYSKHSSMNGLPTVDAEEVTIHGAWRPPYNILNFIYHWLGNLLVVIGVSFGWACKPPYNIPNFIYHWLGNCWWWRFPCPCSHTHIYRFIYILTVMSNNLVNQSTKAISTNELRWIGPVLAVVTSGPMDLFLCTLWCFTSNEPSYQWELIEERCVKWRL